MDVRQPGPNVPAGVRLDDARVERGQFVGGERVTGADQTGFVGVDDRAVAVPDLHEHGGIVEHVLLHRGPDLANRHGSPVKRPLVTTGSTNPGLSPNGFLGIRSRDVTTGHWQGMGSDLHISPI
jgi:hypothetical protein